MEDERLSEKLTAWKASGATVKLIIIFKVPEHKGTCSRDMSLRHVAATKSRAMQGRVAEICSSDI